MQSLVCVLFALGEIHSWFSGHSKFVSNHINAWLIFPVVLVPLIISHVNILRNKILTFPMKYCSSFYRDLWYLLMFTTQDRKSIAREAGCENTGPVSVQLSWASSLMSSESPVSHSLWQRLNSAFPQMTLVLGIQLKTPWVLVPGMSNTPIHSSCPTANTNHCMSRVAAQHLRHPHRVALRLSSWTFCGPNSSFL